MMSAWENLHHALQELVRSTPLKQRLVGAYRRHLASLSSQALPAEAREPFAQLSATMQGVKPLRGEDAVAASVRKMSNQEADECAALIVEIFALTSRALINSARAVESVRASEPARATDLSPV